jgi:GT2 family glycosyltransferase
LGQILDMSARSADLRVHYYVVVDREESPPERLAALAASRSDITLIHAGINEGAPSARNRGIDAGSGDFILFLDDDVRPRKGLLDAYAAAIVDDDRQGPGYAGVTEFPPPSSRFTAGIVASDILTFFALPRTRLSMPWGVTANLCLRRAAMGSLRFSSDFPRQGGGEDIDLCLRVVGQHGNGPLSTVPDAVVDHPWWAGHRRSYKRFFRWAFGDSRLPALHPVYRYRNAPTFPELAFLVIIATPAALLLGWWGLAETVVFLTLAALVELSVDFLKLAVRGTIPHPRTSAEATLVRLSNDIGRLVGNLIRGRPHGLLERFDYFCSGESIAYERKVAGAKLLGWLAMAAAVACGRCVLG